MPLSLPRAVVFDWDNTLVDSWGAISEAINYVRARYGLETWSRDYIVTNCTRSARESFPDWFGDRWQDAWTDYYAYFDKVRQEQGIHPTEGATELLAWLSDRKIPALVVSNKSNHYLHQECAELNWGAYFVAVVGAHDAPRDKPAREHADHALALANLKAGQDIWFVGDSESDVLCARNSGCLPVMVGTYETAAKFNVALYGADCREIKEMLEKASLVQKGQ